MTPTTDLATRNGGAPAYAQAALAISPGQDHWGKTQLAALAQLGIKDASEGDQAVFLHVCQRTGLDPFSQQIYMIPRKERQQDARGNWTDTVRWTIQTGIKGLRVIRDRAERREGVRGKLSRFTYYDPDGNEHKVWVRREPPVACEVTYTVRDRNGTETAYTSVLRFAEYVQHNKDGKAMAQWAPDQKPVHMLEKCTEANAYNKAFPTDFAGLLLDDAMPPPEPLDVQPPRVTAEEIQRRAPRPQGTVIRSATAGGDAPWPGDAAPARPARNANPETGEVIPDGDADPTTSGASSSARAPGSASRTRTGGQSPSSASGSETIPDDPRAAVLAGFDRIKIAGPEIPQYLTRLSGHPYASVDSLSRAAARWFADRLGSLGTRDELEAAAVAAEARREQDAAAEDADALLKAGEVPGE